MPKHIRNFISIIFAIFAVQWPFQALSISIDEVRVEHIAAGDRVTFLMSDPIKLTYELKSAQPTSTEDTILIHLPSGVEWNAPAQGKGNGLIKDYSFEGDLLTLHMNQHVQVKKDGSNTKGYFLDLASISSNTTSTTTSTEEKPLQVRDVRVNVQDEMTRIVLDLTVPMQFNIEQSMSGDKLIIKGQEPVEWKGPKRSFQSEGLVQSFQIKGSNTDAYLEVQTESGAAVQRSVIEDPNGSPKYVIDLLPSNLSATNIDGLFRNSAGLQQNGGAQLGAGVNLQPITGVNFEVKNGDTVVTLNMPRTLEVPVIDNIYTHQVIISLPKVDWTKVSVPLSATGLIKEYKVDQSLPDKTNLILHVQNDAGVIGKRTMVGGANQGAQFVVMISTDNAKIPEWLSEVTAENLPYSPQEKKEGVLATRDIKYRGGVLEYANIGEGLYFTGLLGQVGGANALSTSASSGGAQYVTDYSSTFGGLVGYLGMGYGIQVERSYFGLEGLFGYQQLSNKNEHITGTGHTKFRLLTGLTWLAAGRVGYYVSPVSMLYGKLGVASSTINLAGEGGTSTPILYNSKKKVPRSGFLFGVGVEAAIDDQLSARIETYQTTYQPFKATSTIGLNAKFHPKVQEMLIGISWKPSPMGGPSANELYEDSIATGLYIGGETGLGTMNNHRNVTGTSPNKFNSMSAVIEPLWGLYGGYAHSIGRYYLAGEGQVGFNQTKLTESIKRNSATESFENFLRWSLALSGRFGYIFNHGVIGYGRVGVVTSRFSHDGTNDTGTSIITAQKRFSKSVAGLRLGAGLEIFMSPLLSLRGDYNVDLYPALNFKSKDGSSERVLASRNEFRLGLAYTLPVNK